MANTKVPSVLWNVGQDLNETEKSQARTNIGAASASALDGHKHKVQFNNDSAIELTCNNTTATSLNHSHGNITTDGKVTANAVAIGNKDTILIVDYSDNSIVKKTTLEFDGSTTTEALTKAGTWASFSNYIHPDGSAASKTGVPTGDVTLAFGGSFKVNQISTDSKSHVSAVTERTITMPSLGTTNTTAAAGDHGHGAITSDGKISGSGVAIGSNDTLLIADSSDSSKIKQTSIKFDGSTTTTALTPNGTFEPFAKAADIASKVDTTDSRLLPDADVFVATYSTQSPGTTMEELEAARTANKKIYVKVGGTMTGGVNTYEKMIPLTYVRYNSGSVTGYFFETVIDSLVSSSDSGKITTYWRAANGWGHTPSEVQYAMTASFANEAANASGYVEGGAIAQNLAAKMSTAASNAATEALDNLMTKLGNYSSSDGIADLTTIMAVSYNNGTNWKKLRPETLWNYINSKASAAGYAKRPRIAFLDAPQYYQEGATVEYVEVYDKNTSIPTHQGYQILGNKSNSSSNWGVCHVPTNVDYSKGYCEIEFDLQLWSYYWNGSEIEAYANLDMPYIINFVATTGSNDGASPSMIALDDSKIFATQALSIDCRRGTTASFAHVRLCGRMQSSTSANHAIYIGAQTANDWSVLITRTKMANVRIKYYDDVASMT